MLNSRPLFPGSNDSDQLLRIFKLLGTPSTEHWPEMAELSEYKTDFPVYPRQDLRSNVRNIDDAGLDLLTQMLQYDPNFRITATVAMNHPYFNDLPAQIRAQYPPLS